MIKISFRCSLSEHTELEKYAKKNQKTLSEYIRLRLFAPETVQGKIALYDAVSIQTDHMGVIIEHLAENQKSLTAILNTLFQFMAVDIGIDKARQIFTDIKNKMEAEANEK